MLKFLAALILSLFATPAFAKNVTVFIGQAAGTNEINAGEAGFAASYPALFQTVFDAAGELIEPRYVAVEKLEELTEKLPAVLQAEDRVTSVVFIGHGSRDAYWLTGTNGYNGTQVADAVFASLKTPAEMGKTAPQLLVYFRTCSCGNTEGPGGANLLTAFLERLKALDGGNPIWEEVHAIGHEDFGAVDQRQMAARMSLFKHFFYNTKLPRMLFKFDMKVLTKMGRAWFNGSRDFLKSMISTLIPGLIFAAANHFGTDSPLVEKVLTDIFVPYASLMAGAVLTPLMVHLNSTRTPWVSVSSLRKGQNAVQTDKNTTVYEAITRLLNQVSEASSCDLMLKDGGQALDQTAANP